MTDPSFRLLALLFGIRDVVRPRRGFLEEAGVSAGQTVLDFGCGPGGYTRIASGLVGPRGMVYALDIHPLAVERVDRIAWREGLFNVETILSDRDTGLPDAIVNVVLLYDILHELGDPHGVLAELHRVLAPGGVLSLTDHHLSEDEIVELVTRGGLFALASKGDLTLSFRKS